MIQREELRKNRLFREFSDQEIDMVRVVTDEGTFEDGRLIIAEGSPGDFFGEMSLLESAPVSASVYARGACRLLWIDRKAFDRLIAEDMPIANKLLKAIILTFCERIRDTAAKIESYYRMSKF